MEMRIDHNLWDGTAWNHPTLDEFAVFNPQTGSFALRDFADHVAAGFDEHGLSEPSGLASDHRLSATSPAIDRGAPSWTPAWADFGAYADPETDGLGGPRVLGGPFDLPGTGIVDVGWHERFQDQEVK